MRVDSLGIGNGGESVFELVSEAISREVSNPALRQQQYISLHECAPLTNSTFRVRQWPRILVAKA